jgi:hypothetical protein
MRRQSTLLTVAFAAILLLGFKESAYSADPPANTPTQGTIHNIKPEKREFDMRCKGEDWPCTPGNGVNIDGLTNHSQVIITWSGAKVNGRWVVTKITLAPN